jgi:signal transduction histidine kinase/CheY-like chemotaxis protein
MFIFKQIKGLYTTLPLLLLLFLSGYYAYYYWQVKQDYAVSTEIFTYTQGLHKNENSVFENIASHNDVMQKVNIIEEVHGVQNLKHFLATHSVDKLAKYFEQNPIESSTYAYAKNIKLDVNNQDDNLLFKEYIELLNMIYLSKIENILFEYYAKAKKKIPSSNLILWNKLIEASSASNISLGSEFKNLSAKIDEIRIKVLSSRNINKLKSMKNLSLFKEKIELLERQASYLEYDLSTKIEKRNDMLLLLLAFYSFLFFLSFAGLIHAWNEKKNSKKYKALLNDVGAYLDGLVAQNTKKKSIAGKKHTAAVHDDTTYQSIIDAIRTLNEEKEKYKIESVSKIEYLSTMSHEIRTPLGNIIGFTKLLTELGVRHEQKEFLKLIEASSKKLLGIVNDVLDFSKMNASKMDLDHTSFDIYETIETTISTFSQQSDQKDIELGIFIDPRLESYYLGDALKFSQIITNLVGNAIKFTEPYGKINIFIHAIFDKADSTKIEVRVTDTGIGLSQEEMKDIFNPYRQATKETRRKYGGTGLGLSISSKMVELMGGKLKIESKVNQGTSFSFILVLKKDTSKVYTPHPRFPSVRVGLALPVRNIERQIDKNLKNYMEYLGATFKLYYYDELFESEEEIVLPDIMIFDHHYARLAGELDMCVALECKSVLITSGSLHQRINRKAHQFNTIVFSPLSLHKSITILNSLAQINSNPLPQIKPIAEKKPLEDVDFSHLKVLVADDNVVNRKLIQIVLEKMGLTVTMVNDGKEAYDTYKENHFDIIFMDIQMPVMDGIESMRAILGYEAEKELKHVPIIALTANANSGDRERFIAEGMDDYASKPLDVEKIKALIYTYAIA